ncbi:uncharacterized protein Tco025E_00340 [Trypanosoma conorhini]|uniref:DUF4139 domain-containing protein n=1 Tax=Trypanosoma conorhini TaxID=83891 RepID=A0A422QBP8_9TRYP|nr:uncharacterized protein Tco025E_00340 [Trypanosoma conorhini]RNF27410.1 hypothetical protein Tco025E_00340 [Trypanosoma conorhini]
MPRKPSATEAPADGGVVAVVQAHPRPDAVTAFQSALQVRRVAEVALPATAAAATTSTTAAADDVLQLRFPMPPRFQRDSVQVRFDEHTAAHVVLRGVLFESTPAAEDAAAARQQRQREGEKVKAQIREVERRLELNRLEQQAVNDEADLRSRLFARVCGPVTDGLQAALEVDFWEAQLAELEASTATASTERRRLQKAASDLQAELDRLRQLLFEVGRSCDSPDTDSAPGDEETTACILLRVAEALPRAVVYVSYVSYGASWRAEYEVGLDSQRQSVTLRYNAVVQADAEELQDVALTLSSAAPRRGAAEPRLTPWRLAPAPEKKAHPEMLLFSLACAVDDGDAAEIETAAVSETTGMVNFAVPSRHTLPRGGAELRVPLTVLQWKAAVSYVTVPAAAESVFAKAVCTNASDYALLPGEAAVTLNGDFVANAFVERTAPGAQLSLHFGVDSTIEVRRQLRQQLTTNVKANLFGREAQQRQLFAYATTLTNRKRQETVTVTLRERLPKSNEQKLTVRLLQPKDYATSAADDDGNDERRRRLEVDGVVEMELTLRPDESVEVPFAFEVESPAGARVFGL